MLEEGEVDSLRCDLHPFSIVACDDDLCTFINFKYIISILYKIMRKGFAIHRDWQGFVNFDSVKMTFSREDNPQKNSGKYILTDSELVLKWSNWTKQSLQKLTETLFENESLTIKFIEDVRSNKRTQNFNKIRSFDVFDTLLFRKFMTPHSIFECIESEHQIVDFKRNRISCEEAVRKTKTPCTYDNIYECMKRIYGTDTPRIKKLEIEVEKNNLFPIWENMKDVNTSRDIFISDMYYNASTLRYLLSEYIEIKETQILVSPDGKMTGSIWKHVKKDYDIGLHLGDNEYSDVRMPKKYKIKSSLCTLSEFTKIEKYVDRNLHLRDLALLIRFLRLQNNFKKESDEYRIWRMYHDVYIPYIYMYNCWIRSKLPSYATIYFCERDMNDAYELFNQMFKEDASSVEMLHCSRFAFNYPSMRTREYFEEKLANKHCLVVDLHGSGQSFEKMKTVFNERISAKIVFLFGLQKPNRSSIETLVNLNFINTDFIEKFIFNTKGSMINFDNSNNLLLARLNDSDHHMYNMVSRKVLNLTEIFLENRKVEWKEMNTSANLNNFMTILKTSLLNDRFEKQHFQTCHLKNNFSELTKHKSYQKSHMVLFHTRGPPYDKGIPLARSCSKLQEAFSSTIDEFHVYDTSCLSENNVFATIMSKSFGRFVHHEHQRGVSHGFWFWKPYVIKETLNKISQGELLFYQDCNIHRYPLLLNKNSNEETHGLIELLFQITGSDIVVPIEDNVLKLKQHCKKEVFVKLEANHEFFWNYSLLNANRIILKKTELTTQLINEWYELCCDTDLLLPETEVESDLRWHTHDQALLNILIRKYIFENKLPKHYPGFYLQDKEFMIQNVVCV